MDAARAGWMSQAEVALKGLRDIEDAVIQGQGDDIREIHIVTSSTRPAKQIVRDVQTLLLARFHRVIDHRVVSVAFMQAGSAVAKAAEPVAVSADANASAPSARTPAAAPATTEHRIRFRAANLFVTGPRLQAQVDFQWKGLPRSGTASGL